MSSCTSKRSADESEDFEEKFPKKLCVDDSDSNGQDRDESTGSTEKVTLEGMRKQPTFLTERDVGITEYISDLPGFSALFKERYSDFLVNEVDLEGNIVRLTNFSLPEEKPCDKVEEADFLSCDELKKIEDVAKGVSQEPVSIDVTDKDKDLRRKIHEAIRQNFQGLESTTENRDSQKVIVVAKCNRSNRGRRRRQPQKPSYTHFVLYKENTDTMEAVSRIASFLRFSPKILSYAGTKDRRAKTSQAVSAYKVEAQKLLSVNEKLNRIKIGNVVYKDKEIRLGDLSGNRFVIILRQVKGDDEVINSAMTSLMTRGFINYYGMQRFGTMAVATHRIGRALLLGKWKDAVDLILQPQSEGDEKDRTEACRIWAETQDAKSALDALKCKSSIEGRLLTGLSAHRGNNYFSALNMIPRNTRLMYIHSYQSYIWNSVVSKRIEKFHLKPLPGDLVFSEGTPNDVIVEADNQKPSKVNPGHISADDISSHTDLIYSVVMPLPGHSVMYPGNETKDWYEEFLKEDGMDLSSFKTNVKEYSLTGAYRKIVVKPKDMKWEITFYDDTTAPLVLSDYEILQGSVLPQKREGGKHKAVKIEMCLPSSSYATMALREVLKIDTCQAAQIALSSVS